MGNLEDTSKKRQKRVNIERMILNGVAVTGMLAVALVAPNVIGAMEKIGLVPRGRQGEYIASARRKLKREGLLVERDGFLRLTPKGLKHLNNLTPQMAARLKRWDGKWRILIFDIPEKRRMTRNRIRSLLRGSGFIRIQDSVWLYPDPCEEFVALIKAHCRVGRDMLYLIVDTLEGDGRFRKHFGLPIGDATDTITISGTSGNMLDVLLPEKRYD